jgi:hypothetical protein
MVVDGADVKCGLAWVVSVAEEHELLFCNSNSVGQEKYG